MLSNCIGAWITLLICALSLSSCITASPQWKSFNEETIEPASHGLFTYVFLPKNIRGVKYSDPQLISLYKSLIEAVVFPDKPVNKIFTDRQNNIIYLPSLARGFPEASKLENYDFDLANRYLGGLCCELKLYPELIDRIAHRSGPFLVTDDIGLGISRSRYNYLTRNKSPEDFRKDKKNNMEWHISQDWSSSHFMEARMDWFLLEDLSKSYKNRGDLTWLLFVDLSESDLVNVQKIIDVYLITPDESSYDNRFLKGSSYYNRYKRLSTLGNTLKPLISEPELNVQLLPAIPYFVPTKSNQQNCPPWTDDLDFTQYFKRGETYYYAELYDQAIADFSKSIQMEPNFDGAYFYRGAAYFDEGLYDQAISDFTKAIKMRPSSHGLYGNRGFVYLKKGLYDQAISDLTKAIQIQPSFNVLYGNRGFAYLKKGMYSEALSDFTNAINISPLSPYSAWLYGNRGFAYLNKRMYDDAISDVNKAVEINPIDMLAYWNRAVAYFLVKEYDKSWKDIKKAQDLGYNVHPKFLEDLRKHSGRQK
jgi:tetratricopeptide (TPR) repeat protein